MPSFEFVLDDFSRASDDELRGRALTAFGCATWVCLTKARTAGELVAALWRFVDTFEELISADDGSDALSLLINYIVGAADAPVEELRPFFHRLGPRAEEALMTTAELLKAEGKAEGKAELLTRLLRLKYGELPAAALARLGAAGTDELDRWAERVLSAGTLDDVFEERG